MARQPLSARPAQDSLLAWVPISPSLASARLKGTSVNLTAVAVYALTLDAAEKTHFMMTFRTQSTEFPQETR